MKVDGSHTNLARQGMVSSFLVRTGELFNFTIQFFARFWRRPFEFRELIRQMDEVGSKSVLLTAVTGLAIGVVLAMQSRGTLVRFGAEGMMPNIPGLDFSKMF